MGEPHTPRTTGSASAPADPMTVAPEPATEIPQAAIAPSIEQMIARELERRGRNDRLAGAARWHHAEHGDYPLMECASSRCRAAVAASGVTVDLVHTRRRHDPDEAWTWWAAAAVFSGLLTLFLVVLWALP